jgi:hypothetical protein
MLYNLPCDGRSHYILKEEARGMNLITMMRDIHMYTLYMYISTCIRATL